jgi:hypothetical protein
MNDQKSATITGPIIMIVLLVGFFAAYFGAYLWLGDVTDIPHFTGDYRARRYPSQWMASAFTPMAKIEGVATNVRVVAIPRDPAAPSIPPHVSAGMQSPDGPMSPPPAERHSWTMGFSR